MDKFHHFNIKDEHTCVVCGEKTEDSIRIVEDGYVSFPYNCPICDHHIKTKKIGASYFFKVDGALFYEINGDYGMFSVVKRVWSYDEFTYYKNKQEHDFLEDVYFN